MLFQLIEQLMQMVTKMENERSNYEQQMRDMKSKFLWMKGATVMESIRFLLWNGCYPFP